MPYEGNAKQTSDMDLVQRAKEFEEKAVRTIIQRYNQRLFRIARSILRDDTEAEDVMQEAYIRAFTNLGTFRHESGLGTWLSRIVMNEAFGRLRKRNITPHLQTIDDTVMTDKILPFSLIDQDITPEKTMSQSQIRMFLEQAIDELPDDFRVVLVARAIEEMSIEETAELFGIKPQTVKTRLHRARTMLKEKLEKQMDSALSDIFTFAGRRCQNIADKVVKRLLG